MEEVSAHYPQTPGTRPIFEVSHWFDQCDLHSFERTYEGTHEVHTLVLGKAITGIDAFNCTALLEEGVATGPPLALLMGGCLRKDWHPRALATK